MGRASNLSIKPVPRRQTGEAGAWQGWRTGKLAPAYPKVSPPRPAIEIGRTNGVSNGRKKAAITAVVRQFARVAKLGRAIERDGVMVRESGGAVKHVIHILRLSGAFHLDIMALDGWNCFCRTQGLAGAFYFGRRALWLLWVVFRGVLVLHVAVFIKSEQAEKSLLGMLNTIRRVKSAVVKRNLYADLKNRCGLVLA